MYKETKVHEFCLNYKRENDDVGIIEKFSLNDSSPIGVCI